MIPGKEKIAKILSRLASKEAKKVLAYIAKKNSRLSSDIEELMFEFEDVIMFSQKEMQLLHQKIDTDDLVLALKGLDESQREALLRGLSAKRQAMILSELELTGAVKLKEVEAARQRIADTAREMIEKGEIAPGEEWIE